METQNVVYDVIIIGAGPSGLACAIDSKKQDLSYLLLEKGCLVNSIYGFPTNMIFFSTPELLEIGNIPFIISNDKPTRTELLKYYRIVAQNYDLNINLFERVESVQGQKNNFHIKTNKNKAYSAKNVIIATGQFDNPNLMQIPGENLSKVNHYYTEAHSYFNQNVAVIGGKNSAVEAGLDLYKHGAHVILIHRGEDFGSSVKYWILPDIKNRINENKIRALFNAKVKEIREKNIIVSGKDGQCQEIENDFVFALTGYKPDVDFFKNIGIEIKSQYTPVHNPESLETNMPGIYIAGVITAGSDGSKVFIENSRNHGTLITRHILYGSKN